ncbi:MAG: isochorismatase family protein [Anaerolineales bacterium]|nr:isochorismatase family protein [Anaerolineales bacterium]
MKEHKDTAIMVVNLLVDMIERAKPFPMPPEYDAILDRTISFINQARQAGYPIIFIQDQHRPGDKEFTDFSVGQPHAIRDTDGSQLVSDLLPLGDDDYSVGKRRFSAFFGTDMDLYLREEGIRRLVLVGRPSNVCALYSAADGFMRRYELIAISDCLYSKTGDMHDRAMREFSATLGPVMTSSQFLENGPPQVNGEKTQLALLVVNVNKDLVKKNQPENGTRVALSLGKMKEMIAIARQHDIPVLYAMDAHLVGDWEFRIRKPHAIAGTIGAEVVDELAPKSGDVIFNKRGYDAFYETGLDPWLREHGVDRVIIIGAPTNVDVRHTVVSAYNLRYRPIVIKDCTEASTEEYAVETLADMFFCWRMDLEVFKGWIKKSKEA